MVWLHSKQINTSPYHYYFALNVLDQLHSQINEVLFMSILCGLILR